ncbi:hypothetical protein MYA98_19480 [Salmonella sp. WGH-01]|nr:hypothetical protein MYA98_19480 [Salmonella sp. WGH-01]
MLGLSLLLALLFSHRLRQPHHLWAGCYVVVLLLLLAHMGIFSIGIIGAMPIRHSRWRKKRCYEKSIRLMTAFLNHLMSQAMQPQNAGDWGRIGGLSISQNAFPLLILRAELKNLVGFGHRPA